MTMPLSEQIVLAGMRDASWYRYPSGYSWSSPPVKYHVLAENGAGPACNPDGALLVEETLIEATEVEEIARCRRAGCRSRWPS